MFTIMNRPLVHWSRQALRLAAKTKPVTSYAASSFCKFMSTQTERVVEKVPPEDYYDGHLIADHFEYLDDMMEKSLKLEEVVKDFQDAQSKAKQSYSAVGVRWMEADEIDRLLDSATKHNEDIKVKLAELRALREEAKKTFAVDSPDGESDVDLKAEMEQASHIVEDVAKTENTAAVERQHHVEEQIAEAAKRTLAVDAPDGEPDVELSVEIEQVASIIDDVAKTENMIAIKRKHQIEADIAAGAKSTLAVDAPDGDSDGHVLEELQEIDQMIDDAALLEDKEAIVRQHKAEEAVRKDRARDPEHDW